jgi:hypothetical protein
LFKIPEVSKSFLVKDILSKNIGKFPRRFSLMKFIISGICAAQGSKTQLAALLTTASCAQPLKDFIK